MNGQCCTGEGPSRLARLSGAAASLFPGALLVLLPKCPLCLAALLTMFTGLGISAAGAARLRGLIVILWIAVVALAAAQVIRRRVFHTRRQAAARLHFPRKSFGR